MTKDGKQDNSPNSEKQEPPAMSSDDHSHELAHLKASQLRAEKIIGMDKATHNATEFVKLLLRWNAKDDERARRLLKEVFGEEVPDTPKQP